MVSIYDFNHTKPMKVFKNDFKNPRFTILFCVRPDAGFP